jgi:hypothetical protein
VYEEVKERNPAPQYPALHLRLVPKVYTDKKENKIFLISKEIQKRAVAKSYMTFGLLIYN